LRTLGAAAGTGMLSKFRRKSTNKSKPGRATRTKVRVKRGRSYTRTTTKRKRKHGPTNTIWDAATEKFTKIFRKPMFKRKLGQATVYETWETVSQGTNGIQNVLTLKSIMPTSAIQSGETSTTRTNKDSMATDIWQLHPNTKLTGSAYVTAGTTPREDAIYWRTTDLKLEITSLEPATQECTLLWCMPKTAVENDPIITWSQALSAQAFGNTAAADPGITGAIQTGAGVTSTYGYDPRAIAAWKKAYKVFKVHKFLLPPGETHKINCQFGINKYLAKSWCDDMVDEESFYVPHLTIVPMLIVRGLPVVTGNTTGDPPVLANPTMVHATTKVGVIMTFKHFLNFCDHNRYNFQRVNLGIPVNVSGAAGEQLIDDDEDAIQNIGVPRIPVP